MKDKTYIAGPMTGLPDSNYPAFHEAEARLKERGVVVENPAWNVLPDGEHWIQYMYMGLKQLLDCNSIYMLKGWENSKGARIEFELACNLKMNVEFQ